MTPRAQAAFDRISSFMLDEENFDVQSLLEIAQVCSKLNKSEIVDLRNAYDAFRKEKFPEIKFPELFPTEVKH